MKRISTIFPRFSTINREIAKMVASTGATHFLWATPAEFALRPYVQSLRAHPRHQPQLASRLPAYPSCVATPHDESYKAVRDSLFSTPSPYASGSSDWLPAHSI